MKIHTTNYFNTFIEVADDCLAVSGEIPPKKDNTVSIANLQFELISQNPYKYTSDDIIFEIFARRNDIASFEMENARNEFFSKGQACLRSSPLAKRYGWGVHSDKDGKIALFGRETEQYENFCSDKNLTKVKAMRTKRVK